MSSAASTARRHDYPTDAAGVVHLTYTVDELAEALRLSRGLTYAMLRDGTIPAERAGRRWIISRRRIEAWLDGCREP